MTTTAPSHPDSAAESAPASSYASYVPHDLKYSAEFEDALIAAVLDSTEPPTTAANIRVTPNPELDSNVSLPSIPESDLPLPLSDPRRTHPSFLPGVSLTHPAGYYEGGPGLDPDLDTFPEDFFTRHSSLQTTAQLQRALQKEVGENLELLRERLGARRRAREKNEGLERELKSLRDQHHMELRIHHRMREEKAMKKEARESRRKGKAG
ncbi:hypothetical protein BDY17DRAFT_80454 [Neohortaea acidophila]|uniref:Uncharacterized protein n=1 Tax=Neohortaea acidophila TaxID=245834 RepID=A0A6A6Q2I9_9PEZI|nr:uncharacterized protein BDY17DRAFT_80454 [Neohortaea acidophila]KAF2486525.1 hypothetical protein BDY17DRAFT_80454 [Neohortaea acidophila]